MLQKRNNIPCIYESKKKKLLNRLVGGIYHSVNAVRLMERPSSENGISRLVRRMSNCFFGATDRGLLKVRRQQSKRPKKGVAGRITL